MSSDSTTGATAADASAPLWRDAMASAEVSEQGMHAVNLDGHAIVILQADGELIAYRDACPHEGYPLSQHAQRQDFVIVCQKHLWEFDTGTGEHISRVPRARHNLRRYPVREVGGRVQVDLSVWPLEPAQGQTSPGRAA